MNLNHTAQNRPLRENAIQLSQGEDGRQATNIALAHEVRNPLTNINLAVGMLSLGSDPGNQELFLDIIKRASTRIEEIIRGLLVQAHDNTLHTGKHSIHKLLNEVLATAADRIALKKINVKKMYALQDCNIRFNEPDMKIAITNIVVNAIEAIDKEGGTIKVRTGCEGDNCTIQIEDNGCGISKSNLKKIFKPYYTSKREGIGLGLATTYGIFRTNHASIDVSSTVNRGTCFKLVFEKNLGEFPG